jgi:hypothetical protein
MIEKRINKILPYFKGLKVTDTYKVVELHLKKSWVIIEDEKLDIHTQSKEVKENSNVYYHIFYSDTESFDDMLDYIENGIINYNLEIEEKENLLRAKVEELKRVFESKTLDELNKLKFTTEEESLKLNSKKVNNTKKETEENGVTEELSTNG